VPLECQFLRQRAKFGVYFMLETYFDMERLCLVEKKMLEILSVSVEITIIKALKFSGEKL